MEFFDKCIHVTDEHELGRHEVNLQSFKYVMFDIGGGNERKKIYIRGVLRSKIGLIRETLK